MKGIITKLSNLRCVYPTRLSAMSTLNTTLPVPKKATTNSRSLSSMTEKICWSAINHRSHKEVLRDSC